MTLAPQDSQFIKCKLNLSKIFASILDIKCIFMELSCDTLFENENEWQRHEPISIPLPRTSRNFPDNKTKKKIYNLEFLEALGIGIGTSLGFYHSVSVSNNVDIRSRNEGSDFLVIHLQN